jgi:large subunit ribosomal protein L6
MSRIGNRAIPLPKGVEVKVDGGVVRVKGPKGLLSIPLPARATVTVGGTEIKIGTTPGDASEGSRMQGLARSLVKNMVVGVSEGFKRELDIVGVGYRADVQGRNMTLNLGFSHPIVFPLPEGINAKVEEKQTRIILEGIDRQLLGETAAAIRRFRPPEPYKGKGVRHRGEFVRQKAGKKAATKAA